MAAFLRHRVGVYLGAAFDVAQGSYNTRSSMLIRHAQELLELLFSAAEG